MHYITWIPLRLRVNVLICLHYQAAECVMNGFFVFIFLDFDATYDYDYDLNYDACQYKMLNAS